MTSVSDGASIDKVLQQAVDAGAVPHVAAIAAHRDGVIYQGAAGPRAAGESESAPVTVDTTFRIMSMTKMPCTVVALQEAEKGTLDLDAPVARYCPEFAAVEVLTGFDGDTPRLRPPASQATVRQLLTHTSGLGISGSTAAPGSARRSTAISCRSSHRRGSSCTATSKGPFTRRCEPARGPGRESLGKNLRRTDGGVPPPPPCGPPGGFCDHGHAESDRGSMW
jgi:hypothetical protein